MLVTPSLSARPSGRCPLRKSDLSRRAGYRSGGFIIRLRQSAIAWSGRDDLGREPSAIHNLDLLAALQPVKCCSHGALGKLSIKGAGDLDAALSGMFVNVHQDKVVGGTDP